MKVYCVVDQHGENKGIYHSTYNGAIHYFMMSGERGAYIGSVLSDWINFEKAGTRVQEYDLKEKK